MEKQEKQAIEILHMMCGNNGCVISDSGGKDSSVLKHIALKTKNMYGLEYKIRHKELITLSDEDITASATGKMIFYVVNLYALVKFFERKGYTVSTDKSVFFESDELALKVQERFDCEKLDERADFKVEFTPA